MPGIDTSMYNTAPQPNALQQMSAIQGIANAAQQNQLMQQEQQQRNIQISTAQAQKWDQQLGLVGQALASTYAQDGGNPTRKHVQQAVSDLITQNPGIFDKDFAAKALGDLPSDGEETKAQAQGGSAVKSWLIGHASRNQQGKEAIKPFLPDYRPVDVGGQIQMIDHNPLTNKGLQGMQLQKGFTPAEATAPDTIGYDPATKAPITGTHAQATFYRQGANPIPGALPSAGAVPGGVPVPTPGNGLGITAPAPGSVEAIANVAKTGGEQASDLQRTYEGSPFRQAIISEMQRELPKFEPGPYAKAIGTAKAAVNEVLPQSLQFGQEGVAAQEHFRKLSEMLSQEQFKALGGTGTDQQLTSTRGTSPNEYISKLGNRGLLIQAQANEAAIKAKVDALQKWQKQTGKGPGNYGDFLADFNPKYSPRAFQYSFMNPAERNEFVKSLHPSERGSVADALIQAEKNGWIDLGSNK